MSLDDPPPTARSTRRQRVEEKERAILSAARRIFEGKGYVSARVADVAAAIGVAEGTIYTYFPTKDALVRAMLESFWEGITAEARAAVDGHPDIFARLEALAKSHLALCIRNWSFLELTLRFLPERSQDAQTRSLMRDYVAVFDETFATGQDKGELMEEAELWVARDQFYGALEYSGRTLMLRGNPDPAPVINALISSFRATYGAGGQPKALEGRLAKLEAKSAIQVVRPGKRAL